MTVPRTMTYDPRFGKIVYTPIEEMRSLRSASAIDSVKNGGWSTSLTASTASDVEIFFAKPAVTTTLSVNISTSVVYLKFVPGATTVECGIIRTAKHSKDVVSMLDSDTHVAFRIFIDATVVEVYWQDGRAAMTDLFPLQTAASIAMNLDGGDSSVKLTNATSWQMSSIYVTKGEVLATPRL
jgi:sucrose-6-phosphate hydrolase SacC (GH32 family)